MSYIDNGTLVSYLKRADLLTAQLPSINKLHIKSNIVDKQVDVTDLLYINSIINPETEEISDSRIGSIKEITFETKNKNDNYDLDFINTQCAWLSITKFDAYIYYSNLRDIINVFPNVTEFNYYHPNEYEDKGYLGYMYCLSRQYPGIKFVCTS